MRLANTKAISHNLLICYPLEALDVKPENSDQRKPSLGHGGPRLLEDSVLFQRQECDPAVGDILYFL
jgi:hypothetical protein